MASDFRLWNRLRAAVGQGARFIVQNHLLSSKALGYRHLETVGLGEYCQLPSHRIQEHCSARTVPCPLPLNITSRADLNQDCGRYERSFYDVPEFQVSASFSATVQDCRILRTRNEWGDDFYAIVTPDDRLLTSSGTSFRPEHAALLRSGRISRSLDQVTWVTTHSTRNHYMWLYTHLPRVILAESLGLKDQILFPEESLLSPVKRSTLDRLGYQDPQFIQADDEVIRVGQLNLLEVDGFDPWALNQLRDRLVGDVQAGDPARLYISREKCHYRKLKNETEIWAQLQRRGFEKVFLEELTLEQQIQKLRSAEVVLGVHGAGFANVLFCQPGTRVIEIQDPDDPNPHFYALAALLGLEYCLLMGDVNPSEESHFRDISISLGLLQSLLE